MKLFRFAILVLSMVAVSLQVAHCQELEPAEVIGNVMAEHAMTPAVYWKAPMSLDLDLALVPEVPVIFHVPAAVDADAPARAEAPLPVRTAAWQSPPATGCTGVCVTFSAQGAAALKAITGKRIKGFELVAAETCNISPTDRKFGGGLIIQQANSMNIQTLTARAGTAIVQETVDMNWRKVVLLALNVGTSVAMGATSSGVIAASRAWTSGLVFGHLAIDNLPALLKPGAPNPDPFLNNVLDDQGQIILASGACVSAMFSGVWSRDAVKVTGRVQLLP